MAYSQMRKEERRRQKAMMTTPRHARRIDLPAELAAPTFLPRRANRRASFLAIFIAESFMNSNFSLCVGVPIGAGLNRKQGILRNEMEFQRARGPNSECPASLPPRGHGIIMVPSHLNEPSSLSLSHFLRHAMRGGRLAF